jgi:hypothetical protein
MGNDPRGRLCVRTARASRSAQPQLGLPPLLRGQTWWLRLRQAPPGDSSHQRPTKTLKGSERSALAAPAAPPAAAGPGALPEGRSLTLGGYVPFGDDAADLRALLRQGPLAGSMAKFKLLCYTNRTLCFRNLGTPLAKGAVDLAKYMSSIGQLLSSALFDGMPAGSKSALHELVQLWGHWILSLSQGQRTRLADGYLAFYRDFMRQYAEGWRPSGMAGAAGQGKAAPGGLYIIISPHPQGAGVAAELASRLGTAVVAPKDACSSAGPALLFEARADGVVES